MKFDEVVGEHGPALWRVIASYAHPARSATIAGMLRITPENVAVRLGRARDALRRSIEKEEAA